MVLEDLCRSMIVTQPCLRAGLDEVLDHDFFHTSDVEEDLSDLENDRSPMGYRSGVDNSYDDTMIEHSYQSVALSVRPREGVSSKSRGNTPRMAQQSSIPFPEPFSPGLDSDMSFETDLVHGRAPWMGDVGSHLAAPPPTSARTPNVSTHIPVHSSPLRRALLNAASKSNARPTQQDVDRDEEFEALLNEKVDMSKLSRPTRLLSDASFGSLHFPSPLCTGDRSVKQESLPQDVFDHQPGSPDAKDDPEDGGVNHTEEVQQSVQEMALQDDAQIPASALRNEPSHEHEIQDEPFDQPEHPTMIAGDAAAEGQIHQDATPDQEQDFADSESAHSGSSEQQSVIASSVDDSPSSFHNVLDRLDQMEELAAQLGQLVIKTRRDVLEIINRQDQQQEVEADDTDQAYDAEAFGAGVQDFEAAHDSQKTAASPARASELAQSHHTAAVSEGSYHSDAEDEVDRPVTQGSIHDQTTKLGSTASASKASLASSYEFIAPIEETKRQKAASPVISLSKTKANRVSTTTSRSRPHEDQEHLQGSPPKARRIKSPMPLLTVEIAQNSPADAAVRVIPLTPRSAQRHYDKILTESGVHKRGKGLGYRAPISGQEGEIHHERQNSGNILIRGFSTLRARRAATDNLSSQVVETPTHARATASHVRSKSASFAALFPPTIPLPQPQAPQDEPNEEVEESPTSFLPMSSDRRSSFSFSTILSKEAGVPASGAARQQYSVRRGNGGVPKTPVGNGGQLWRRFKGGKAPATVAMGTI